MSSAQQQQQQQQVQQRKGHPNRRAGVCCTQSCRYLNGRDGVLLHC